MRTQPIRILSLIEADFITGAAKPLYEFARRARQGAIGDQLVEQTIVVFRRGQEPENAFVQAVRSAGVALEVLPEEGRFDKRVPALLRQLVEDRNPDIVETNNIKSHLFARLSGIWETRPWVAFHHGFTAEDIKMRLYNLTSRWSLKRAQRVVTVCGPFRERLVKQGIARDRIYVQHNPVAPFAPPSEDSITAMRALLPMQPGTPLLICIGRLSLEKGHADLVAALAELRRSGTIAHLAIAGEGPEQSNLEADLHRLELKEQVTFLGLVKDVRPLYRLADLMVLPSHSEGSPNVLLEAMAAECAIVATRVGGIPEIVEHETSALLVPPQNPGALSTAIQRVLNDKALRQRLTSVGLQLASTRHTVGTYAEERVRFYQQLLEK
jgi:glycosyltransferase involved in cell wall biosynthesis